MNKIDLGGEALMVGDRVVFDVGTSGFVVRNGKVLDIKANGDITIEEIPKTDTFPGYNAIRNAIADFANGTMYKEVQYK